MRPLRYKYLALAFLLTLHFAGAPTPIRVAVMPALHEPGRGSVDLSYSASGISESSSHADTASGQCTGTGDAQITSEA